MGVFYSFIVVYEEFQECGLCFLYDFCKLLLEVG